MSIKLLTLVWSNAPYSGGTLLVLLALADWGRDDGSRIFPTVDSLAEKARLSVRATQYALRQLVDDGVLAEVKTASGRRGYGTEYKIDVGRVQNMHPTGAIDDTDGCNLEHPRVQSATAHIEEPLLVEPLREPLEGKGAKTRAANGASSLSEAKNGHNPHEPTLEALRLALAGDSKIWLDGAQLLENDAGGLVLSVPRKFQMDGLKNKFWLKLDRVLGEGKWAVERVPA